MLNPAKLLKLRSLWSVFEKNHPKFPKFLQAARKNALEEGAVIEINITSPDGKTLSSNLKVTNSDKELWNQMSELWNG